MTTAPMKKLLVVFALALLSSAGAQAALLEYQATAKTGSFTADAGDMPVSATTTFFEPVWGNGDPENTAHHELLHAIGFTVLYDRFDDHVFPDGGKRKFTENTDGSGDILGKLVSASLGTHIDPAAGFVNGTDQADSIMQPALVFGQRMGSFERAMLDAAFDWSNVNIDIAVVFAGPGWTDTLKDFADAAVADAHALFGSDESGHDFTWTVQITVVPLPGGIWLFISAVGVLGGLRKFKP